MMVLSRLSAPDATPSRTICSAARSLTEPPGLQNSALAQISTPGRGSSLPSRMSGVPPMRSTIDSPDSVRIALTTPPSQRQRLLERAPGEQRRLLDAGVARPHVADLDTHERIERARRLGNRLRRDD